MNQRAKIYQPVKTAMQSGKARTKFWILEFNKSNSNKDYINQRYNLIQTIEIFPIKHIF